MKLYTTLCHHRSKFKLWVKDVIEQLVREHGAVLDGTTEFDMREAPSALVWQELNDQESECVVAVNLKGFVVDSPLDDEKTIPFNEADADFLLELLKHMEAAVPEDESEPDDVADYVKNPQFCPWCGTVHIEWPGTPDVDDGCVKQKAKCVECGMRWMDVYRLETVEERE